MLNRTRIQAALMIGLLVCVLAPGAATAQKSSAAETREIESYVLTEAGLSKYTLATKNLRAHAKELPKDCDSDANGESLAKMVARIDAVPAARAAITSAGLTTREYYVFTLSLLHNGLASWALTQPGGKLPAGTSMANVNFVRAHEAALAKLHKATDSDSDDCDDRSSEDNS